MSKIKDKQRVIRAWKDETGETAIDMHKVALWAVAKGWPLPTPQKPIDILAKQFADAGREQIEHDPETGNPYRVYHSVPVKIGGQLTFLWYDIHEATRKVMHKSLINRREQMVSDGVQLTFDAMYWAKCHPNEKPIDLPMDLTEDIEWRKNAPKDDDEEAA
jgi:hypothetical protein